MLRDDTMEALSSVFEDYKTGDEEGSSQAPSYRLGDSDWALIDGDTAKNLKTGQRVRVGNIDTREIGRIITEGSDAGFKHGEVGGELATQYIWDLANRHGFTKVSAGDELDTHDRSLGELYDPDGVALSDMMLASGMALPGYMGKSKETTDPYGSDVYMGGVYQREMRDLNFDKLSDWEKAAKLLRSAETAHSGGIPIEKVMAFNMQEYAANPDLYKGIRTRIDGADPEGMAYSPMSASWDVSWMGIGKGFDQVMWKMADEAGFEDAATYFASDVATAEREMAEMPMLQSDITQVDWSSFNESTDYLATIFGSSLPYMTMTIAGMAAAPVVGALGAGAAAVGTAGALGATSTGMMYTGLVLDEMEGDISDKNLPLAIGAGALMMVADRLGLKGVIGPNQFLTGSGKAELIKHLTAKGMTEAAAEKQIASMAKLELAKLSKDGFKFAQDQVVKGALFKRVAGQLSRGAVFEGSTELLQEMTQYTAAVLGSDKEWNFDEVENRMINAIAAGGIMGGALSVPKTAFDVGDWSATADYLDPSKADRYNTKFDYAEEEELKRQGKVRSNDEWADDLQAAASSRVEQAALSSKDKSTSAYNSDGSRKPSNDSMMESAANSHRNNNPEGFLGAKDIWAFIKNPQNFFRSSASRAMIKLAEVDSEAARLLSVFGYTRHGIFHGSNFAEYQRVKQASHETLSGKAVDNYKKFDSDPLSSSTAKQAYASDMINAFYKEVLAPITGRKNRKGVKTMGVRQAMSKINWDKIDPKYLKNREALESSLIKYEAMLNRVFEETNKVNAKAEKSLIHNLQDFMFRHKGFKREYIDANKARFIQLLSKEYRMSHTQATKIADNIINDTVLDDNKEFNVMEGGVSPSEYESRTLGLSDNALFDEFLEQDFFNNVEEVSRMSSRYQTHMKFLGRNGEVMDQAFRNLYRGLMVKAGTDTERQAEAKSQFNEAAFHVRNLINAESGNYKRIDSYYLKTAQKYLTLLTAMQGLGLAAVSSFPEVGLLFHGVPRKVLVDNIGLAGYQAGKALASYAANLGEITRVSGAAEKLGLKDKAKSKEEPVARSVKDPRRMFAGSPETIVQRVGLSLQETGAATTTGMVETNQLTKHIADAFFKSNFLQDQTQMHRNIRAAFFNDFLIDKMDLIMSYRGKEPTPELMESRKMLKDLGIDVEAMTRISNQMLGLPDISSLTHEDTMRMEELNKKVKDGRSLTASEKASFTRINNFLKSRSGWDGLSQADQSTWERNFLTGAGRFINQAVPMPDAFNRPIPYSNQHLMLLTQFNGYISAFTANQLPRLWDGLKYSKGLRYSTFASAATMLFMGFLSQAMKDELKYGEPSPYLTDREKVLRMIYSSGLIGTGERIIGSPMLLPLYGSSSRDFTEWTWNNVASEAAAAGTVERFYRIAEGYFEDDDAKMMKSFYGSLPFLGPMKHRLYEVTQWK